MNYDETLHTLLHELIAEKETIQNIQIPADLNGRRSLLRALINIRPPTPIQPNLLHLQDMILSSERDAKIIINPYSLASIDKKFPNFDFPLADKLALWKGDITTLATDAIVNAANLKLLGCFIPHHKCIDNVIHSAAGIQLRLECNELMQKQGYDEPTGEAKITKAYNLPSKYVIHTVGPIISGAVTAEEERLLAACYTACLEKARQHKDIKTVAFCCISTGEFRFPKSEAARIAVQTVCNWLTYFPNEVDRVIFNVFTQEDFNEYTSIFS